MSGYRTKTSCGDTTTILGLWDGPESERLRVVVTGHENGIVDVYAVTGQTRRHIVRLNACFSNDMRRTMPLVVDI